MYAADGSYSQSSNLRSFHTVRWKASWCLRIYTIVALLLLRQQKADILKSTSSQKICFMAFIIWFYMYVRGGCAFIIWCIEQWATFEKLYQCYTSVLALVFLRHHKKILSKQTLSKSLCFTKYMSSIEGRIFKKIIQMGFIWCIRVREFPSRHEVSRLPSYRKVKLLKFCPIVMIYGAFSSEQMFWEFLPHIVRESQDFHHTVRY